MTLQKNSNIAVVTSAFANQMSVAKWSSGWIAHLTQLDLVFSCLAAPAPGQLG